MNAAVTQEALVRDNLYLRQRNTQLQEDAVALSSENARLRQTLERLHGRKPVSLAPNPLSGGQG